jgi:RNA polymerase sigma-70 factor, ECF subfamily
MADSRALMTAYCGGDAEAFRELYRLVAPQLFGYLVTMARDRAVAADLLQQTLMKVHRARAAYIRGADPIPWICAIAHRTFLDHARKRQRSIVQLVADPDDGIELAGERDKIEGGDPELGAAALAALAELPHDQRQAVVLTKLEGKSVAEAAEIAGTTVGAMKLRAHRGYRALRAALDRDRPPARAEAGGASR